MLFYKRVELEEENGKDFSFDVSPDLLEVTSEPKPGGAPLSLRRSVKCRCLFLFQWIWHDNMQFLQDKNIFEHTYFGWVSDPLPAPSSRSDCVH